MPKKLILVVVLIAVAGCAHRGVLVTDPRLTVFALAHTVDRTRIVGAVVRVGPYACTTGRLGSCRMVVRPGDYPLRVSARGFSAYEGTFRVTTDVMLRVPLLEVQ